MKEFPTDNKLIENTSQSPNIELITERRVLIEEFGCTIAGCSMSPTTDDTFVRRALRCESKIRNFPVSGLTRVQDNKISLIQENTIPFAGFKSL